MSPTSNAGPESMPGPQIFLVRLRARKQGRWNGPAFDVE